VKSNVWRSRLPRASAVAFVITLGLSSPAVAQAGAPPPSQLGSLGHELFTAIVSGNYAAAAPLFFPAPAYVAMKQGQLLDPSSDYRHRLWAFYQLDLSAYHAWLAGSPATYVATLRLSGGPTWIPPGVCENGFGYWHEPALRLVYRQGGVLKSFAVTSLISWRGRYYVIHLGPNPRPVNVGTVAAPAVGPGHPGPAGGC
jgi:hypothetical protein